MRLTLAAVAGLLLVGCASGPAPSNTALDPPATPPVTTPSEPATSSQPARPEADPAALDKLEAQIRQLFVIHVYGSGGDTATAAQRDANTRLYGAETPAEVIKTVRPGGVIYIRRNPQDPDAPDLDTGNLQSIEQLTALSADLQRAAQQAGLPSLLIATDQENGTITRLPGPGQSFPGAAELGAAADAERARQVALSTGQALAQVGINVNLAPVADVDTNPNNPVIGDRAFSDDADIVGRMAAAQVDGYRAAGIAPTLKHFPGHGHASVDSHTELPTIAIPRTDWDDTHLPPFTAGIDAGAPLIMTAHIAAPAFDDTGTPATLSRPVITGILRDQLGYDGLVVTDSLWMRAVRDVATDAELATQALQAGADLLLMPADIDRMVTAIRDAVRGGEIAHVRIRQSNQRLDTLREWLDESHGAGGTDPRR